MRLVYKGTQLEILVKVGDEVIINKVTYVVEYFRKPHSPASSGKVTVRRPKAPGGEEYYVNIINAEWVDREDRP
jgi:hypothetical protein